MGSRPLLRDDVAGSGGWGAGYAKKNSFSAVAGTPIPFSLGTVGTVADVSGGDTWFSSTSTLLASGGNSGTPTTPVGDTTFAGGAPLASLEAAVPLAVVLLVQEELVLAGGNTSGDGASGGGGNGGGTAGVNATGNGTAGGNGVAGTGGAGGTSAPDCRFSWW